MVYRTDEGGLKVETNAFDFLSCSFLIAIIGWEAPCPFFFFSFDIKRAAEY